MASSHRLSTFSSVSQARPTGGSSSGGGPQSQVSTQTLLNDLHNAFNSSIPHALECSTSLVVNTCFTAEQVTPDGRPNGTVDPELAERVWQHARRRAEDGSVVLGSLHQSSPSILSSFASALPLQTPQSFFISLAVIRAFTHCVTPFNPSLPRYSSLAAKFTLNQEGSLINTSLSLSASGLDTQNGLLRIPSETGFRAFDVFYYLNVSSASKAERDVLNLRPCSAYSLLRRSGTFAPPGYMPTADDAAAAEDFRHNLRAIGIKGPSLQNLISALAGVLKLGDTLDYLVDEEALDSICDDAALLLDLDTEVLRHKCTTEDRAIFIAGVYESIVDWVLRHANAAMKEEMKSRGMGDADEIADDTVAITVIDVPDPNLGKAIALRTVFDDSQGINLEMKEDGVAIVPAGASVLNEMRSAVASCGPDLGEMDSAAGRERDIERDRREGVLEKIALQAASDSYVKELLHPSAGLGVTLGTTDGGRFHLANTLNSSRVWFQLTVHPTDDLPSALLTSPSQWSAAAVSSQLRAWRLPEWANRRRRLDYTADFDPLEFVERYASLGCQEGKEGIDTWLLERGWTNGEVVVGESRVWLRESAWWEAECMKDALPGQGATPMGSGYSTATPGMDGSFFADVPPGSRDNLIPGGQKNSLSLAPSGTGPGSIVQSRSVSAGDYGLGRKGDQYKGQVTYEGDLGDLEAANGKVIEERPITFSRRMWLIFVWALTWWVPSPLLHFVGRMKRPDVRLAWREKVSLVFVIMFLNGVVVFYIIFFGPLLCPKWDKAWSQTEVGFHQGNDDFWVSHRGKVYDITKFWRVQHSDMAIETTADNMTPFMGKNLDAYITPPLTLACPSFVSDPTVVLTANTTVDTPQGIHVSGPTLQTDPRTKLHSIKWYTDTFLPKMKHYYKGDLVWDKKFILNQGQNNWHSWVIISGSVYDLTDYFYTRNKVRKGASTYQFIPSWFEDMVTNFNGQDVTQTFFGSSNATSRKDTMTCLNNYFYVGQTDYRKTPRCQVNNYMLLAFTVILCTVIGVKFLAALQLGSKRRPAPQEKFVICQVPAYTEGEDQLRKGLDSLTALAYDNKRKLICVICDGVIVGAGNDRPTPKIVLDILGVDPKTDPPALPFKSVGQGSEQLNYGKVYSGLYECEGNVVPYMVVVKIGKESEQHKPKPGNRGKRDSQILLMSFLNRVHHRAPMSPLELEMFHQISNVIGVDPELYEYLLMVDADTMVKEDSLNRLVAACAADEKIAGICGETSLQNEERSWWTMIQVYEYYISHHLAKSFESLFGSVTCLPGCFCMYRLRTAERGRPLIISDKVMEEYSDGNVDTLHKKNLLSLGEDRYLTTLMTKHFPSMSYKFVPTALAYTAAPDRWSVLLSQRRRWINSTIHNLVELMWLKDMCGFCCFSMRFVIFIDLFSTIILPATCAYLGFLLYKVGTHSGQFPLVSLIMLAAVYGLQAVIFIIKRQWQHIGWMVIYIVAFPIYSFVLPIYSFWKQDDFSWGSTRLVVEEKGATKIVAMDHDDAFDPRSIPLMRWDDYAAANALPGRRGVIEKYDLPMSGAAQATGGMPFDDDMRSVVSSVKPASTVLGGYGRVTPAPMPMPNARNSVYTLGRVTPAPMGSHDRHGSFGSFHQDGAGMPRPVSTVYPVVSGSQDNLVVPGSNSSTPNLRASTLGAPGARTSMARPVSSINLLERPASQVNFMDGPRTGPSDAEIVAVVRQCLGEVELENVTKKHVVALAELKLQCQLQGERRQFLYAAIDAELERMD